MINKPPLARLCPKALVPATDPGLRLVSAPFDLANRQLLAECASALKSAVKRHGGVGLALPQLGMRLRGFIISADLFMPARFRICFNPVIISTRPERITAEEGCLSLPGQFYQVERLSAISVEYFDASGRHFSESLYGRQARVFQHELDHLDGILISDFGKLAPEPSTQPKPPPRKSSSHVLLSALALSTFVGSISADKTATLVHTP